MTIAIVSLVILLSIVTVWGIRQSGKAAEEKSVRETAEANALTLKKVLEGVVEQKDDRIARLEAVLSRYRTALEAAEKDLVVTADPQVRRRRFAELGKIIDLVPEFESEITARGGIKP